MIGLPSFYRPATRTTPAVSPDVTLKILSGFILGAKTCYELRKTDSLSLGFGFLPHVDLISLIVYYYTWFKKVCQL